MATSRIVFLGSDGIALPLLGWLTEQAADRAQVVAVYTQPDRPVGRGQKVQANAIKVWAQERGIPVFQPERLKDAELEQLRGLNADLGLVMAYGHILKDAFIAAPRLGMVNFHASLLPEYRGASPIQTSVAQGEKRTGVTLMRIVRALDAGPMADAEAVAIGVSDTALEVEAKLAAACAPLLARNLDALLAGTLVFREQEHAKASFCRKLCKEDGVLDFNQPASVLAARINGLFPWPATSTLIAGQAVKLGLAQSRGGNSGTPAGTVLGFSDGALEISTADGVLRLLKLQRPGGKMLPASDFLRGFPIEPGVQLASLPMPSLLVPGKH